MSRNRSSFSLRSSGTSRRQGRFRPRLLVEPLEDRTLPNAAPVIDPIMDHLLTSNRETEDIVIVATDSDNDALTYWAESAGTEAYFLDSQRDLQFTGNFAQDWGGEQERWLRDKDEIWYFLKPNGDFFQWDGSKNATGTQLASLEPIFYHAPELLYEATRDDLAFQIDKALDLVFTGNLTENAFGAGERWLRGNKPLLGQNQPWYFIKPNGQLVWWDGTKNQARGTLLAQLDPFYYDQIHFLYDAQPRQLPISISDNIVTLEPPHGVVGTFTVGVTVDDGTQETHATFQTTLASSETNTTTFQHTANAEFHLGIETGIVVDDGAVIPFASKKGSVTAGYTFNFTDETAVESRREYEKSLATEKEVTQGFTTERTVEGATMQVTVNLHNLSDLAFRVQNLQITALIQDPLDRSKLTPIATLVPDAEPAEGFILGPLVADRGPIIFSNDTIIPSLVESLMANSSGLIFRISNYDIVDENERNFAFTSQDVVDRTGLVILDFGGASQLLAEVNGKNFDQTDPPPQVEIHRVATSGGRAIADSNGDGKIDAVPRELFDANGDPKSFTLPDGTVLTLDINGDGELNAADATYEDDTHVIFDGKGKEVGITLHQALAAIGLTRYDENTTPTANLTPEQIDNSYSTRQVFFEPGGDSLERIHRIRSIKNDEINDRFWEILSPLGILRDVNLESLILTPDDPISLNFVQDLDKDGLPADVEYLLRTSDSDKDENGDGVADGRDTDKDGLDDRFEALIGWTVNTPQRTFQVYSSPNRADSNFDAPEPGDDTDGDGREDLDEYDGSDFFAAPAGWKDANNNGLRDRFEVSQIDESDYVLDPIRKDTDGDGLNDATEIIGFAIRRITDGTMFVRSTNPNSPFTDSDTFSDGFERDVGLDPTDGNDTDEDGDGLPDPVETAGWKVTTFGVSTMPYVLGGSKRAVVAFTSESADVGVLDPGFGRGTLVRVTADGGGLRAGVDYFLRFNIENDGRRTYSFYDTEAHAKDLTSILGRINFTDEIRAGIISSTEVFFRPSPVFFANATDTINEWVAFDPDFASGTGVRVSASGGGLLVGTEYFVAKLSGGTYYLYSSAADAIVRSVDNRFDLKGDINDLVAGHTAIKKAKTDSVGSDEDGLTDFEEFFLKTDPTSKDTDGDGIEDRVEHLGYELGHNVGDDSLGFIKTDPLDADTDTDMRSDGDEAELVDVEQKRWAVRVQGQAPYQVFSNPLVADADFDGIVDGDEFDIGRLQPASAGLGIRTDPNNGDTDGDGRDDGTEITGGTNPLAEDFRVTVFFNELHISEDGDPAADNPGDFTFNFGVRLPGGGTAELSSAFTSVVTEGMRLTSPFNFAFTPTSALSQLNCRVAHFTNDELAMICVMANSTF